MTRSPNKLIPADFATLPGLDALDAVSVSLLGDTSAPGAIGHVVFTDGDVPGALGHDRESLSQLGFDAKPGQSLVLVPAQGPLVVAVGAGASNDLDANRLRDLAATLRRAAHRASSVAIELPESVTGVEGGLEAVVEGALLASYRYTVLKKDPKHAALTEFSVGGAHIAADALAAASKAAMVTARAAAVARDLANTPPGHLTATDMGLIAQELGERFGFGVELFDKQALIEMGCGGLLGVNQGSTEEPRMIKLTYSPKSAAGGHLGLVGKGIMYDSGGISLKPSDPMHLLMKMDMAGAAAVLGAFAGLRDRGVTSQVSGWLSCTDNMPSGTSLKLGDVLTARGGTTIEIKNTDAEGRLVLADALVLATEDKVDAIIDIATLTGAALMALGTSTAPVFGNNDALVDLTLDAASTVDEPLWRLPLERKYRPQLDSDIADIANLGGKFAGATTAALFLSDFVGETPWAHIDIAGTMNTDKDDSWRASGSTGYGARLLLEAAFHYAA